MSQTGVKGFSTKYVQEIMTKPTSRKLFKLELSEAEKENGCRLGLDTHADISCVGKHARVLCYHEGQFCDVQPFHDSYDPLQGIKTCDAIFAYDSPTGETLIIRINQCLDFTSEMEHSILCTNQVRDHGIIVEDIPLRFDVTRKSRHCILLPTSEIILPLETHGIVSYLPVRYPNDIDMEEGIWIELTSDSTWKPYSESDSFNMSAMSQITDAVFDEMSGRDAERRIVNSYRISRISYRDSESPEKLSATWRISLSDARRTIDTTTRNSIMENHKKLTRRYKTHAHQRRYRQLSGYLGQFASDTFNAKVPSIRGNEYAQLFSNRGNFVKSYPIKNKSDAHHALDRFLHEVGVPSEMLTDGAKELHLAQWGEKCKKYSIPQLQTEPHSPWQNPSELSGGIIKRRVKDVMRSTQAPIRLWDYCWEYLSELRCLTASDHITLDGRTPFEKVLGYTPDISEFIQHQWYNWIWFFDPNDNDERLRRYLGPSHSSGQGHAHYILTDKAKVVTRSTVRDLNNDELKNVSIIERMDEFTKGIESLIGNYSKATMTHTDYNDNDPYDNIFEMDNLDDDEILPISLEEDANSTFIPDVDAVEDDPLYMEEGDKYVGMEVNLPHQGEMKSGRVIGRKRNAEGNLLGTSNKNPLLDTRQYEIAFPDGTHADYSVNMIIENMYSQVEDDGRTSSILKSIIDHKCDQTAIPKEHGWLTLANGSKRRIVTTKGWKLKIEWEDGSSSWIPLSVIKEANPIETAEYAKLRGIDTEPAFA